MQIVVTGVSGSGKSTVCEHLANRLNYPYFDGDDFHPQENIDKMSTGTPLNDQDRQGWLATLNQLLQDNKQAVLACSALKPEYRQCLKQGNPDLVFVYLKGDFETIWQRHQQRNDHYFAGKEMLESQFSALVEPSPTEAIIIDIKHSVEDIVEKIAEQIVEKITEKIAEQIAE